MILQTGGTALGEISTKSKPSASAMSIALGVETTIGRFLQQPILPQ